MMKRFAIAALVVGALAMAANNEARAQGISIGFGGFGPGYSGFGPGYGGFGPGYGGFGYGPGIGINVGPSLGYGRVGYGGYGYRPSYGVGYGGLNRSVYSYGSASPVYSVRRPAYSSYGRVSRGYCR